VKAMWCPWCDSADIGAYDEHIWLAECHECHKYFNRSDEARSLFHRLWGWSKNAKQDYHKDVWSRLREILNF
jgi:hypothetical protein